MKTYFADYGELGIKGILMGRTDSLSLGLAIHKQPFMSKCFFFKGRGLRWGHRRWYKPRQSESSIEILPASQEPISSRLPLTSATRWSLVSKSEVLDFQSKSDDRRATSPISAYPWNVPAPWRDLLITCSTCNLNLSMNVLPPNTHHFRRPNTSHRSLHLFFLFDPLYWFWNFWWLSLNWFMINQKRTQGARWNAQESSFTYSWVTSLFCFSLSRCQPDIYPRENDFLLKIVVDDLQSSVKVFWRLWRH